MCVPKRGTAAGGGEGGDVGASPQDIVKGSWRHFQMFIGDKTDKTGCVFLFFLEGAADISSGVCSDKTKFF